MSRPRSRRQLLKLLSTSVAGGVFARALWARSASGEPVSDAMIAQAAWISGLELTDDERRLMLDGVRELEETFEEIRRVPLDNGVPPALRFEPQRARPPKAMRRTRSVPVRRPVDRPEGDDELAFASVATLAALIRDRTLSSAELTTVYLDRLKRYDPQLRCVIELTEELALEQARRADRELAAGRDRGALHGIPWGAKDLLAVPGYRTTWGARPFRDQLRSEEATVVRRLAEAGAVLVAKLSLGALAWGDVWFGGQTRNPWKLEQGSSGSSAGPAAASAAGLVAFAIGSETWGSIVSPCTRCGATGLRPTFGRVSRHGAMALSWSMDKLGPIARTAEDCALVFDAIHGADPLDPAAVERPFSWPPERAVAKLRVGFVAEWFDDPSDDRVVDAEPHRREKEWRSLDRATLETLKEIGCTLVPMKLPERYPVDKLSFILTAEASAAFDDLTRSGRDDLLVRQVADAWPNVMRQGQLIPAVEYIRANRIRSLLLQEMESALAEVDLYVCPSFGGNNLLLTNLTGHPCVVLPNGFRSDDGTPTSITFTGRLDGESDLLAVAHAYQQATEFHLARPSLPA